MEEQKSKPVNIDLIIFIITLIFFILMQFFLISWYDSYTASTIGIAVKPIIYIYPEEDTEVTVTLGNTKSLTTIYPNFNIENGWKVLAKKDGTLVDTNNNKKYYSLYWEGTASKKEITDGFVIKSENVAEFLEEKLEILGLNYKEKQEFIIYWLPQLQEKEYVYIRFQTPQEIEENMPLNINPTPDTLIRIMMVWKGLDNYKEVPQQHLNKVTRNGYTVVEWGGTEIK